MASTGNSRESASPVIRIFGWIFGSLSVLNLVQDATSLELYGRIRDWSDAYGFFIETFSEVCFGWVAFSWFKIDELEGHVLVISVLLGGTLGRAMYASDLARGRAGKLHNYLVICISSLFSAFVLLVLLLASPLGARIGLGCEAGMIGFWAVRGGVVVKTT